MPTGTSAPPMPDNITTRSLITFPDMDTELRLISTLPKDVQDWVLFNSPVSLDVQDLIDEHRRRMQSSDAFWSGRFADSDVVWRRILVDLKNIYHNEAVELYGNGYPFVKPKLWVRRQVDSRPGPWYGSSPGGAGSAAECRGHGLRRRLRRQHHRAPQTGS